jgi:cytochrome c-type biogenesis protein CcmH
MPTRRAFFPVLLALSLLAGVAAAEPALTREQLSAMPPAPGERALEGRLRAPCCNTQTLDGHESEPARALKLQIRARLYAGETVESVEQSIVDRYGEGIRATPPRDPMRLVAAGLFAAMAAAGVALTRVLRRWKRQAATRTAPAIAPGPRDAYDERLDSELEALD